MYEYKWWDCFARLPRVVLLGLPVIPLTSNAYKEMLPAQLYKMIYFFKKPNFENPYNRAKWQCQHALLVTKKKQYNFCHIIECT